MTARLHYISRYYGAGNPSRWVVFLHGVLGSGSNWAGFAADLARQKPTWGVLAVDLRHHGRSGSGTPPDSVSACVDDLLECFAEKKIQIGAVVGHSFGSKIGLELCARISGVEFCAVIDADPGRLETAAKTREEFPVLRLIDVLKRGSRIYKSRDEFVTEMFNAGFREGIAGWVGKNLKRTDAGLVIDLDFDRIEEMLEDHHRLDLWALVESPPCLRLEFYIGERSRVVPESSRQRIATLAKAKPEQLSLTVIQDAGHWLHVDAPQVLLELLVNGIPE